MALVAEIVVPQPPPLSQEPDGSAQTSGQVYTVTMPATADQPTTIQSPDGAQFWASPRELAFRDFAGVIDYVTGASPATLTIDGFGARYRQVYPWSADVYADDHYLIMREGVKNIALLSSVPRSPAEFLSPDPDPETGIGIEMGVSWAIGGVPLSPGMWTDIEEWGFRFARPVVRALDGAECQGRYQVVDGTDGQTMFAWFPYAWFREHPGPYSIDPSVGTSNASTATAYSHQRKMIRFPSNGVLLAVFRDASGNIVCRVSTDQAQTWTTPTTGGTVGAYSGVSMSPDPDEYVHLALLRTSPDSRILYARGVPDAARTGITWTVVGVDTGVSELTDYYPDIATVMREGTGWVVWLAFGQVNTYTSSNALSIRRINIAADGTATPQSVGTDVDSISGTATHPDGTIESDSNKTVWAVAFRTNRVKSRHAVYDAGSWTWQAEETIEGSTGVASGALSATGDDQGRRIVAFRKTSDNLLTVRRRSTAGVWSEVTGIPAVTPTSVGVVTIGSEIYVVFTYSGGLGYLRHDGSAWGSVVNLSTDTTLNHVSVQRSPATLDAINLIATRNSASPYTIESFRVPLNAAPYAPSDLTRTAFDATTAAQFVWQHIDPNPGDGQSNYQLQIVRVSDGVTVVDTGKVAATTSSYTLPGGTLANGVQYQWRVMTWDQSNLSSPWSGYATVTTSAKPVPMLLAPTSGSTVGSSEAVVSWSAGDQSKYRVRLYDEAGTTLLTDTGEIASVSGRSRTVTGLAQSTSYQVSVQVANSAGIWSDEVKSGAFTVSYTPPNAVRNLAAIADAAMAAVKLRWSRDYVAIATFSRSSIAYLSDGTQAADGQPRYDTAGGASGIWVEESATNLFDADRSQTFSSAWTSGVLNGTYTVSIKGATGSLALSGGATGTVSAGGSLTFTVSSATVTFTPTSSPTHCQLEQRSYATSWNLGGATRSAETLTVSTTGLTPARGCWRQWVYVNDAAKRAGGWNRVFNVPKPSGTNPYQGVLLLHDNGTTNWRVETGNEGGLGSAAAFADSFTPNGWHLFEVKWHAGELKVIVDGMLRGTISTPVLPAAFGSTAYVGSDIYGAAHLDTIHGQVQLRTDYPTDAESLAAYNLGVNGLARDANTVALYSWADTLEGGTQPGVFSGQYEIFRGSVRIALVDNPASGDSEYDDYAVGSGVPYAYSVRAVGNNGTYGPTETVEGGTSFTDWRFDPVDGSDQVRFTHNSDVSWHPEEEVQVPATQSQFRRTYRGPAWAHLADIQATFSDRDGLTTREWRERLLGYIRAGTAGYLRSPAGDVWRGVLSAPGIKPHAATGWEAIRCQFRETREAV